MGILTYSLIGVAAVILFMFIMSKTLFSSFGAHEQMFQDLKDANQWKRELKAARKNRK